MREQSDAWPVGGGAGLLGRPVLDRMHEAAAAMLERTGVAVEHAEVRRAIAGRAGFTDRNGRIAIRRDRIEALVARLRATAEPVVRRAPEAPLGLGVDDRASWIVVGDDPAPRPMTRADVVASAKLVTMLGPRGVTGHTTGVPTDVPAPLVPLEQFMIGAEFSRAGGSTSDVTDLPTAGAIRDFARACGRRFGRTVWSPSPLVLGGPELDILWAFRDEVEDVYVGSMPVMGFTGPCDPVAVFTVGVAECLGAAAILGELLPRVSLRIGPHPEPADPATGVMVFGSPEWEVLDLLHREVHEHYGTACGNKLIHTTASRPGVQAAADHAGGMLLAAVGGYASVSPGGMLALDEVYSPAMLVLDADLLAHAGRVARGAWSGDGLGLEDLAAVVDRVVGEGGVFGADETTVVNHRAQVHRPAVLRRLNRAQWERAGRPDEVRAAQAEADRLVAAFDYVPPAGLLRDLQAIYARAKARLGA